MRWFLANTLFLAISIVTCFAADTKSLGQINEQPAVLPPPGTALPLLGPANSLSPDPVPTAPAGIPDLGSLVAPPRQLVAPGVALDLVTPAVEPAAERSQVLETTPVIVTPTPMWYHLAYWFGPTPWDIGFELGINGTKGINEAISFRTGGHLKRETDFWKFDSTLVYNKNSANGLETQNNSLLDVRVDRKLSESPWSLYLLNQELYDEFQAYDLRVSANIGLGYEFVNTEHLDLVGRFGAGASREFGGPEDNTAYEALFGLEYDHELSKTQRLSAKVDYFPEWEDFSRYRAITDVGWEIDLDRPGNLSLKFSIIDRYDSTPNGVNPNEVNYSVLLIWGI